MFLPLYKSHSNRVTTPGPFLLWLLLCTVWSISPICSLEPQAAAAAVAQVHPQMQRAEAINTIIPSAVATAVAALQGQGRLGRLAIVNSRPYHLEVVAGLIHVLHGHVDKLVVYLHPNNIPGASHAFGFIEWMLSEYPTVRFYRMPQGRFRRQDHIIFVSPEYRTKYIKSFIQGAKPSNVVLFVHNGDSPSVESLLAMPAPRVRLMALAPHVARHISQAMNISHVQWVLPTKPLRPPSQPCPPRHQRRALAAARATGTAAEHALAPNATLSALPTGESRTGQSCVQDLCDKGIISCLSGFGVQGNLQKSRRNYSSLWDDLRALRSGTITADPRLHCVVLGRGAARSVGVPKELLKHRIVQVHPNLDYPKFYVVLQRTLSLIPLVASPDYYTVKISSSIITSLVTGTPLLLDGAMLRAFSGSFFENLPAPAYYEQRGNESLLQSMLRVLGLPEEEHLRRRAAVRGLQARLNAQAKRELMRNFHDAM